MGRYLVRRLVLVVVTVFLVTVATFLMTRFIPGSVIEVMLEGHQYAETVEELKRRLGLDRPLVVQYLDWFLGLFRGDFGQSLWTGDSALKEFLRRFPVTLELSILSLLFSLLLALPVGVVSAIRQDTWLDYLGRSLAIGALSIPYFWLGTVVVVLGSVYLKWSPSPEFVGFLENPVKNLKIFLIPALIFGFSRAGPLMRIARSAMLDVLREDYIRTARAKGLGERVVIVRHALRNALIPVISLLGLQMPLYFGGSVIMEYIFQLPGMGGFFFEVITKRDYPMIQTLTLFFALMVILTNLVVDISYSYIDPRIRYERS